MGEIDRTRSLTQSELAAVLRRAAQLDSEASLPVPSDALDPLVVEAAAIEAGLSPQAVRQALREVMHPDRTPPNPYEGGLLPARELTVAREVTGTVGDIEERIGRFLRRQLFEQKRLFADGSMWGPRTGWAANFRRGIDPGGRLALKQVKKVSVSVTEIESAEPESESTASESADVESSAAEPRSASRVLVRVTVDLSAVRSIHSAWLTGGAVSGAAVVGVTAAVAGIDPVVLATLPVAGGLTAGGHFLGRLNARNEIEQIHTGVAGLLDRLEFPDRDRPSRRSRGSEGARMHDVVNRHMRGGR